MKKIGLLPRLVIAIILGILFGSFMPAWFIRIFATFNGIFGNFLNFAIPLIIIGFVVPGIGDLGKGAGKILALTACVAYISTVLAGSLAYFVDITFFPTFLKEGALVIDATNPENQLLSSYITIEMPPIMEVMTALIFSFLMGLGISAIKGNVIKNAFNELQEIISKLISNVIIPLLPFHVCGIFSNMTKAGTVFQILSVFARVFVIIIALHIIVIIIQYTIAGVSTGKNPFKLIRRMIPAYMTAIGTQSSAATIPVTLEQTKNNGVREHVADFVVPLCATIHLSGSTITLTSCAIAIMMMNGMDYSFANILPFILMLGITMVAAPGVPGGAVMAALGILQSMLGFDDTLTALMIALYLAQDSFGTACNVTGDGAIAIFVDKITSGWNNK